MWSQKAELFAQVSAHGWTITELENWEFHSWADEIWLLESTWSPVGCRAYVTFLVDPMLGDWQHRKKGESVWALRVSRAEPKHAMALGNSFEISLNQGWHKELPALLKHLSKLRDEGKNACK